MKIIKAGVLVSYDFNCLYTSLPLIYPFVDECILCIDKDRKTWAGSDFYIPESFFEWVNSIDIEDKIQIYEDTFYVPGLSAMECETRERNLLAKAMGKSDWYMQIDSDEYCLNLGTILKKLRFWEIAEPVTIMAQVLPIFKKLENGYLLIEAADDFLPLISNNAEYTIARLNKKNRIVRWEDFLILHQSWGREEEDDLKTKLANWGHKDDFDTRGYLKLWQAIDEQTYGFIRDFHPLSPKAWPRLKLVSAKSINDLLERKAEIIKLTMS